MDSLPLAGCVIVVTADRRKDELAAALERKGATIVAAPALSTIHLLDDAALVDASRALIASPPDVVVATTGMGFSGWMRVAGAAGLGDELVGALRGATLIARGPKARGAIQAAGLTADWVAESETASEVRDYLLAEGVAGLRVAVQHHGSGADGLDEAFDAAGADVASVVVYRWAAPVDEAPHREALVAVAEGRADAVVFTSAPAAESWLATARELGLMADVTARVASGEVFVAAVGPVTAAPLQAAGLRVSFPSRWRMGALVRDVVAHLGEGAGGVRTASGHLVLRATAAVLDGAVLPLTPTGLCVLRALVRAKGGVVTREQIAGMLPSDRATSHAVDAAINRLRENSGHPALVKTVVKRGYALAVSE